MRTIKFKENKTYAARFIGDYDQAITFAGYEVETGKKYVTSSISLHSDADRVDIYLAGWRAPTTLLRVPVEDFYETE